MPIPQVPGDDDSHDTQLAKHKDDLHININLKCQILRK